MEGRKHHRLYNCFISQFNLYNNSINPLNLNVSQTHSISVIFTDFEEWLEKGKSYNLTVVIDPNNLINEMNEENNLESNISFSYKSEITQPSQPADYFMFTMILTLLLISIPLLAAFLYIRRKKSIIKLDQAQIEQKDISEESIQESLLGEQGSSDDQTEEITRRTYPEEQHHKKKKPISRATPEEMASSSELTEERLEQMAMTESEMTFEEYKAICLVHKGEITRNVYICPSCKSFYCDRCARVLKLKGEKCWYCKAEIEIQLRDSDKVFLLEKRAITLVEELIIEDERVRELVSQRKEIEVLPELESEAFYLMNPEDLNKIDLLDLSIEEKKAFIQEILEFPFEGRGELIERKLEVKEDG